MPWFSRVLLLVALVALAAGCASWLPAPTPMRTRADRASPNAQARCLLVLLPGVGDSDETFADHGFIEALRKRGISVDTISADATLGYYTRGTVLNRVETDILAPVRKAGYQEIWFAGVSLGGMGSVLVAEHHARELAGIILIAPFLGDDDVLTEISDAGGVARWRPPAVIDKDDYQREAWRWLKGATEKPEAAPAIYLLSGDQDKLAFGHRLLAHAVQVGHLFRTRGNHDWGPWSRLWNDFLDHSEFGNHCAR